MMEWIGVIMTCMVIAAAGYGFLRMVNYEEEHNVIKEKAQLIDCWEYQGYNSLTIGRFGHIPAGRRLKEMRYVGVFRLENGEEVTLSAKYSLAEVPRYEEGQLEHCNGEMLYFTCPSMEEKISV